MDKQATISKLKSLIYNGIRCNDNLPVAIKHIDITTRQHYTTDHIKRRNHEAHILQALTHPYVIKLYDHYTTPT